MNINKNVFLLTHKILSIFDEPIASMLGGIYIEQFMDPKDFTLQLEHISEYLGSPFGRRQLILRAQDEYTASISSQYKGFLDLSDAFECFFLETIEIANQINSKSSDVARNCNFQFYRIFTSRLRENFHSLCSSKLSALHGYPFPAYRLLRGISDGAILTSATLQKFTDFHSVIGTELGKSYAPKHARKVRKNTELKVISKMRGTQSDLTEDTKNELSRWDEVFDLEMHPELLSMTNSKKFLLNMGPLPILPTFTELPFVFFMNRFCETNWMIHRLLTNIQLPNTTFPSGWKKKWTILDKSFETLVDITRQHEKKIGKAMVEFIKLKFPFHENTFFPL